MPGDPALKRATHADVLAQPEHVVAEVVHGVLHTMRRPRLRHAAAASVLGAELVPPFTRGRGGPGGWIILDEPELHLGDEPDIHTWRGDAVVRAEPFDAIELELAALWAR